MQPDGKIVDWAPSRDPRRLSPSDRPRGRPPSVPRGPCAGAPRGRRAPRSGSAALCQHFQVRDRHRPTAAPRQVGVDDIDLEPVAEALSPRLGRDPTHRPQVRRADQADLGPGHRRRVRARRVLVGQLVVRHDQLRPQQRLGRPRRRLDQGRPTVEVAQQGEGGAVHRQRAEPLRRHQGEFGGRAVSDHPRARRRPPRGEPILPLLPQEGPDLPFHEAAGDHPDRTDLDQLGERGRASEGPTDDDAPGQIGGHPVRRPLLVRRRHRHPQPAATGRAKADDAEQAGPDGADHDRLPAADVLDVPRHQRRHLAAVDRHQRDDPRLRIDLGHGGRDRGRDGDVAQPAARPRQAGGGVGRNRPPVGAGPTPARADPRSARRSGPPARPARPRR